MFNYTLKIVEPYTGLIKFHTVPRSRFILDKFYEVHKRDEKIVEFAEERGLQLTLD